MWILKKRCHWKTFFVFSLLRDGVQIWQKEYWNVLLGCSYKRVCSCTCFVYHHSYTMCHIVWFQMRNWFANYSKPRDEAWGYAQWKPVMYTSTQRKNADLSHATSYPNIAVDQKYLTSHHLPDRSMFHAYFLHDYDEVS